MGTGDLRRFRNTRALGVRISDGVSFAGWVSWVDPNRLGLRPNEDAPKLLPGDVVSLSLTCLSGHTEFQARVRAFALECAIIELPSYVRIVAPKLTARYAVSPQVAHLEVDDETLRVEICDVSESGVGVVSSSPLDIGKAAHLFIETTRGMVQSPVRCEDCGAIEADLTVRLGLRFESMSRLDTARWHRVLSEAHLS